MNNCLCNMFDDKCLWIVIIALLVLFSSNNGCGCGSCGSSCGCNNGYGCGNNTGCGC